MGVRCFRIHTHRENIGKYAATNNKRKETNTRRHQKRVSCTPTLACFEHIIIHVPVGDYRKVRPEDALCPNTFPFENLVSFVEAAAATALFRADAMYK